MSHTSHKHVHRYQSMKRNGVHPDTAVYFVELEAKMDNIAAQMATKAEVSALRESMTREFSAVRGEIGQLREETTKEFRTQTRWFIGTILTVVVAPAIWQAWQYIAGIFAR